ncbi:hypothetical protein BGX38DRAFT_1269441 [Terfezia claveryi]|nr:hypothetical protein BGX38DRAFT_1269441 [Terfezia claveryi]
MAAAYIATHSPANQSSKGCHNAAVGKEQKQRKRQTPDPNTESRYRSTEAQDIRADTITDTSWHPSSIKKLQLLLEGMSCLMDGMQKLGTPSEEVGKSVWEKFLPEGHFVEALEGKMTFLEEANFWQKKCREAEERSFEAESARDKAWTEEVEALSQQEKKGKEIGDWRRLWRRTRGEE